MPARSSRTAQRLVALGLLAVACGEAGLLDGAGSRSQDAVYSDSTTSTAVLVDAVTEREVGAVAAVGLVWFNDEIQQQYEGDPSYVIQKVWGRHATDGSRFIQASRLEIADALPDIRFPGLIPDEVGWITSQLVYDTSSGTLDSDIAAAFGLWAVAPYTVTDGSIAVLRVGVASKVEQAAAFEIIPDDVVEGLSLNWVTGRFRYELFCRNSLPEALCWQMAETNKLLEGQLADAGVTRAAG